MRIRFYRGGRRWALIFSFVLCCALLPGPESSALTAMEESTIRAYEKVAPSVVNITTMQCDQEFFWCATPAQSGSGSGVVLRDDGLIVTNNHVIANARQISVALSDGRRLEARVLAAAANEDFAVLKVDPGQKPLRAIQLGDSDTLKVGERVLAVGNPFGLGQTLTAGTVSMTNRTIKDGGKMLRNLIQTDAPINPGNSGGALVNSEGELVGICTAILSPTGSSIRIGFAIPVNRMKQVVPGLMQPWSRIVGWILAALLLIWFLRRIYGRRPVPVA
ncbi:MAG: trypsin-like peptidase domain-containing protein [Syntrophobacteraceae bacterium]